MPSFTLDETFYGETQAPYQDGFTQVIDSSYLRSAREFKMDFLPPSLERVFDHKTWLGDKLKHVFEPKVTYEYVTGIGQDFNKIIHFDEKDLLSNTNEVVYSLTNRIYAKRGKDVTEIFSWQLSQARYFDPTFGGAVIDGQRNVVLSQLELTPLTFLDGPRTYSPIVSALRARPFWNIGFEWVVDYDPVLHNIVVSTASVDYRKGKYFVSVGHNATRGETYTLPYAYTLEPQSQMRAAAALVAVYDYRAAVLQYAIAQVTYNTDCCGFSVQLARLNFGLRDETEYRFAFAVANLGSFGTLKRQENVF
jgi:LPS-assembly protein